MNNTQAHTQVVRRGLRFSMIVGSILVLINQSNRLIDGPYDLDLLVRVTLTYLTPFAVSVFSSLLSSRASASTQLETQDALDASVRFPTMNPNPVLRVARSDGSLRFFNRAAQPVCASLNLSVDSTLSRADLESFIQGAASQTPLELEYSGRTYELLVVSVDGYDFFNAYGTDVTAQRALTRFPAMNPNPVLRVNRTDGSLRFNNHAAQDVCKGLNLDTNTPLTFEHLQSFKDAADGHTPVEIDYLGRTYELGVIDVEGFDFYNAYGTDVTAQRALTRFPAMNPNPVLRVNRSDGSLRFNNQAAQNVCKGLNLDNNTPLTSEHLQSFKDAADGHTPVEVNYLGRTYELGVIDVDGFDFYNAYGTDVTAQRALTRFPAMNPNPVLRVCREDGSWRFSNRAAAPVCAGLGLAAERPLTAEWLTAFRQSAHTGTPVIVSHEERVYELKVLDVSGFDFLNAYGRDVTAERMVARLNLENQRLLRNILPIPIIKRLQNGEALIADQIPEMSVLFADLAGFTKMSTELQPEALLTILNEIFSTFDNLAERFHLEKIKTIGDAYMIVGGLQGAKDHLHQIVRLGIEMKRGIEVYNQSHTDRPLSLRIGIQVGEGVAGVIGIKKFIYDVWGDTVNTASRMESTGIPGQIQVTQEVVDGVGDEFQFTSRGKIQVKGKGLMETFLLDFHDVKSDSPSTQRS